MELRVFDQRGINHQDININPPRTMLGGVRHERIFNRPTTFAKGPREFQNSADLFADFHFSALLFYETETFLYLRGKEMCPKISIFNKSYGWNFSKFKFSPSLINPDCSIYLKKYDCTRKIKISKWNILIAAELRYAEMEETRVATMCICVM